MRFEIKRWLMVFWLWCKIKFVSTTFYLNVQGVGIQTINTTDMKGDVGYSTFGILTNHIENFSWRESSRCLHFSLYDGKKTQNEMKIENSFYWIWLSISHSIWHSINSSTVIFNECYSNHLHWLINVIKNGIYHRIHSKHLYETKTESNQFGYAFLFGWTEEERGKIIHIFGNISADYQINWIKLNLSCLYPFN